VYLLTKNLKIKRLSQKLDYKKVGLFRIKRVKELVNFKLDLSKGTRIYLVFYILLLELVDA
jgi:ribosomal protein L11